MMCWLNSELSSAETIWKRSQDKNWIKQRMIQQWKPFQFFWNVWRSSPNRPSRIMPQSSSRLLLFGKLTLNIQLMNNKKEDASAAEIKTFLYRRRQFIEFAQTTTTQPFHWASMNQLDAPRQAQQQEPDVKRLSKRFDSNCVYCDKTGHGDQNAVKRLATLKPAQLNREIANKQTNKRQVNSTTRS